MVRKYLIFYIIDAIWIIFFLVLAILENSSSVTGLPALGALGRFVLFAGLSLAGIIALAITATIQLISKKRHKRNK